MLGLNEFVSANLAGVSVFLLIWYILLAAGGWKMFEKAGEPGWKALIPIYNYYILFKICWTTRMFWIWVMLGFVTGLLTGLANNNMMLYLADALGLLAAIMTCVLYYNLSMSFGHGLGYFLGLVFLSSIFIMIIGFSSDRYRGNRYTYTL